MDNFKLDGKLALVTGGSKGIGLGIAEALAQAGADIILVARDEGQLIEAADSLKGTGQKIYVAPFDLGRPEEIEACISL